MKALRIFFQEYDDYEDSGDSYIQTTPVPDYESRRSSPRRAQHPNLNQDEIYYDEVYFEEDDLSYNRKAPWQKVSNIHFKYWLS